MSSVPFTGATRLLRAAGHSWRGLVATWRTEAAFRQELLLSVPLLVLIAALDLSSVARALLVVTLGLIWVVELLNTAIEAVVDRVGSDWHALSGKAKDAGSAAVTLSLLLHAAVWICVL
ncbi:diacylglycerol kinase [Luteimonas sp. TWI662]|uniref:diacylglycerol kinase n=1 Tax=unclassified Luteimonas TaxID=2629088 RepID=UPI00320B0A64